MLNTFSTSIPMFITTHLYAEYDLFKVQKVWLSLVIILSMLLRISSTMLQKLFQMLLIIGSLCSLSYISS